MTERSVVLDTTVRLVFDGALVLSVYLLFAGHNQPGGGFVGGLVAAAAFGLVFLAGGSEEVSSRVRVRPWFLLAAGLGLTVAAAIWPLFTAEAPLDQEAVEATLPLLGKVKATSATVFDTGVYLIVVGLVLTALATLGDDVEEAAGDESSGGAEDVGGGEGRR